MNSKLRMLKKHLIALLIIAFLASTVSLSLANPGEISIPFTPFWQGDYGNVLGCTKDDAVCQEARKKGHTISEVGCSLVSMAMLYWAYGFYYKVDENNAPIYDHRNFGLFNPRWMNEYLSDKKHFGFNSIYDIDWWKTTTYFYYANAFGPYNHYVAPNYNCHPGEDLACFNPDWSNSKAQTLLDLDLQNWTPPIMKISYKDSTGNHPSHFVVIAGWDDSKKEYRAHNPAKHDNADTKPKALNTQYGTDKYKLLKLYRFTGAWSSARLNTSRLDLGIHSPVEIQIVDPEGRRTGYDPATGTKLQENPMSLYYEETSPSSISGNATPSEPYKKLTIVKPIQGSHIIQLFGTGDGPYTIDIEGMVR